MMDIIELLQSEIHKESSAIAPQTTRLIELSKLLIEEHETLRTKIRYASHDLQSAINTLTADTDRKHSLRLLPETPEDPLRDTAKSQAQSSFRQPRKKSASRRIA